MTTKMDFVVPQNIPPIATYRVMNSEGVLEDENDILQVVKHEQVLEWYKNMVFGMSICSEQSLQPLFNKMPVFSSDLGHDHVRCPETGTTELLHG